MWSLPNSQAKWLVQNSSPKQTDVLEKRQVATLHFTLTIRERARAAMAKGKSKQSPPMSAGIAVTWATGLGIVLNIKRIEEGKWHTIRQSYHQSSP
jgi:hypothetical protein